MPNQLRGLKEEALETCKVRGHRMSRFTSFGYGAAQAICRECGKTVTCETYPAPNSTKISGEAVALNCRD